MNEPPMEETKYCDPCAQECVSELEPMVKKLRDFIEFQMGHYRKIKRLKKRLYEKRWKGQQ
jgi:hypothetical protein